MRVPHVFLFILVSLLAVSFLHSPGTDDMDFWTMWLRNAETHGLRGGYEANQADYPPLTMAVFFVVAKTARLLHLEPFLALKLSLTLFLLLTSILFWIWTRDLFLAALLQLVLMLNSVALGYIDIYTAPFLVLSLWALREGNWLLFTVLYTVAALIKWQPLIFAPFILLYLLGVRDLREWRKIDLRGLALPVILPALGIVVLVGAVFGPECLRAFQKAMGNPFVSGNALNLAWIETQFLQVIAAERYGSLVDGHAIVMQTEDWWVHALPKLIFYGLYGMTWVAFLRREKSFENLMLYSLTGFVVYYTFNTGVHENHLFVACILATTLFWRDRSQLMTFVIWTLVANMNLLIFYGAYGTGLSFSGVGYVDMAVVVSAVNVALGTVFFIEVMRKGRGAWAEGVSDVDRIHHR